MLRNMGAKEIIILVKDDRIYFNPDISISIKATNIPANALVFRSNESFYWKVAMVGYHNEDKRLEVEVIDYLSKDIALFELQQPRKPINALTFEALDWKFIEPMVAAFKKSELPGLIKNIDIEPKVEVPKPTQRSFFKYQPDLSEVVTEQNLEFSVDINDLTFKLGFVTFSRYINAVEADVDFYIANDFLLPEFNFIRFWFAKKLKSKRIKVTARVVIKQDQVIDTSASSKQINLINQEFIEGIKNQRTLSLDKALKTTEIDKSLFTADELFAQINTEDEEGNIFKQSEEDILQSFLGDVEVRNKKHLAYLAAQKQSDKYKIRYTIHPQFGFLFMAEGETCNHFIWELLNSHATYVWSIDKKAINLDLQIQKINHAINLVRNYGRDYYKRSYRENQHDPNLVFAQIKHNEIGSDFVDAFPKWKAQLNEQLI
jgi:hypothetical protein